MERTVRFSVNGAPAQVTVEDRRTLLDVLRDDLALTGTHAGCEHGVCGACTVILDGAAVRACLMFAVQAEGTDITTVEGLAPPGELNGVQQAFLDAHGLQCGFCTPGFVVSLTAYLDEVPGASDEQLVAALSGNLCRCTGYQTVLTAARAARDGGFVSHGSEAPS